MISNTSSIASVTLLDATTTDIIDQYLQDLLFFERNANNGIHSLDSLASKANDSDSQHSIGVKNLKEKWQRILSVCAEKRKGLEELRREISDGRSQEIQRLLERTKEVQNRLCKMQKSLEEAKPENKDENSNQSMLHPLDASEEDSKKYEQGISQISHEMNIFEKETWPAFKQLVDEFSQRSPSYTSVVLEPIVEQHDHFVIELEQSREHCAWFVRGNSFAIVGRAVEQEMEIVRKTMYDTRKPVTDDAILNLESRVEMIQSTIEALQTEYHDLVDTNISDTLFADYLQKLSSTYEAVRDWVDQVRVWFTEAKRIREWIAERIDIITARNEASEHLDPLDSSMDVNNENIQTLHREHETLRQEVEQFDKDDMARLRTHVKTLTVTERDKDLSPADTSTIEITLTTLNMLNRLKQLVADRHMLLSMLLSRKQWENQFADAVEWIAATDKEISKFLLNAARWSVKSQENTEQVVNTLVTLEHKITEFDQGAYSQVLDAYQELEDLNNEATAEQRLPEHLEKRQEGFEGAFADLMKRSAFCRKVVEQHLFILEVTKQFRQLRNHGESLRQLLMETSVDNDNPSTLDEEVLFEQVQEFKDKSAYFVSNYAAHVPYPATPEMKTAIGVNDAHDNEIANESIRSEINTYGMSLALIADGLDQLLDTRYSILSLQRRAKEACTEMARIKAWMEERSRSFQRSLFDLSSQQDLFVIDDEEFARMEKERDNTLLRLSQIEEEDLMSILQSVQQLETDIDAANTSAIDRASIVTHAETLIASHQKLRDVLQQSGRDIDLLKKQLAWQSQWTKTNHGILALARKLWDFASKKARYDLSRDDPENPSYAQDNENAQTLQSLQDRVAEIQNKSLNALLENYELVCDGYAAPLQIPKFIVDKQTSLQTSLDELKRLSTYTSELLIQRSAIIEFLLRVQDAFRNGGKLKDTCNKFTRRINDESTDASLLEARVKEFQLEVDRIWAECGRSMLYPKLDALELLKQVQSKANVSGCNEETESLLQRKYSELQELRKQVDRLFDAFQKTREMYLAVKRYNTEASELHGWIESQRQLLRKQRINIATDSSVFKQMSESDLLALNERHQELISTVKHFEETQIKDLHDNVATTLQDKNVSLDVSAVAHSVAKIMEGLERIKQELADHQVSLEAASKRLAWEKDIDEAAAMLDKMNEKLKEFNTNKTTFAALEDLSLEHVDQLNSQWKELESEKKRFKKSILPQIEADFKNFTAYFARLARPIATPDHIEACMDSLSRSFARFEENTDKHITNLELDLMKRRALLEGRVQGVLSVLAEQEKQLDEFVQKEARWYPGIKITDDDEHLLRNQWARYNDQFSNSCSADIEPLENEIGTLLRECSADNAWILSGGFRSKLQEIQKEKSRRQNHLLFANQVVSQRCLMAAFSFRVAQLEQSAELIREEFASEGSTDTIESYKEQQERLDRFKSGINDIRENLASIIPFPCRSNVMDDETTNSAIRETIQTQSKRLEELHRSLQELLETKQKHSRKILAHQSYQMDYKTCREWISSRQQMLSKVKEDQNQLEQLREGLRIVTTIESTMKAKDSVFATLLASFDKYLAILAEDDEEHAEQQESQQFKNLEQEWNLLLLDITTTKTSLSYSLKVAETLHNGRHLSENLRRLRDTVVAADAATLEDDELSRWQEQINSLEAHDYVELQNASAGIPDNEQVKQIVDEAGDLASEIRTIVTKLYDSVNTLRLYNTYNENAAALESKILEISEVVKRSLQDMLSHRLENGADNIEIPKELRSQLEDCKEAYDDLCGYYSFIGKQTTLSGQLQTKQNNLQAEWNALQESMAELQNSTTQLAKQAKCYENLLGLYQQLRELKESVQACDKPSTEYLSDVEQKMQHLQESFADVSSVASKVSTTEQNNATVTSQIDIVSAAINDLNVIAGDLKLAIEKAKLLEILQNDASKILQAITPQLESVHGVKNSSVKVTDIDKMMHSSSEISANARRALESCQDDFNSTLLPSHRRLELEFCCTAYELDKVLQPVTDSINSLHKALQSEDQSYQQMKLANQYTRQLQQIFAQLDSVTSTIQSLNDTDIASLEDTKAQFQSVEEAYDSIKKWQSALFDSLAKSSVNDQRLDIITVKVSNDSKYFEEKMASARRKMLETESRIYKASKYSKAVNRVREVQKHIDTLKDRLSVIRISSGKSTIQQDIYDIKQEADDIRLDELETLLAQLSTNDEIHQRYKKLKSDYEELKKLIDARLEELSSQTSISEFLQIAADLEEIATKLATAVEDAAPHHAAIVNNKFNKPDLQELLKALVEAYKQHEPVMTATVAKLKAEAANHENDDRVTTRLKQVLAFCNKVKASAAARERELQTCISQLDHDFFTKLAAAKSTKRTPRRQKEKQQQQQTSSPPHHQQQPLPPSIPRRPSSQLGNHAGGNRVRRSHTPVVPPSKTPRPPSRTVSRTSYVPDPKNELDVELGRIVNETPYRVKVKMVPGEVGKYWIGDVNPRLVYCRILPSKLVMVRVGGGWVELSK